MQGMNSLRIRFMSPNLHPLEIGYNRVYINNAILWALPRVISLCLAINRDYTGPFLTLTETVIPDAESA